MVSNKKQRHISLIQFQNVSGATCDSNAVNYKRVLKIKECVSNNRESDMSILFRLSNNQNDYMYSYHFILSGLLMFLCFLIVFANKYIPRWLFSHFIYSTMEWYSCCSFVFFLLLLSSLCHRKQNTLFVMLLFSIWIKPFK